MVSLLHHLLIAVLVGLGSAAFVADAAAATRKSVRTNPFAQPLAVAPAAASHNRVSAKASSINDAPLQLRGVLQAGTDSFANVDGIIVGLGEMVAGMRLQSVAESAAVFSRNGKKVVLEVSSTLPAVATVAPALTPLTSNVALRKDVVTEIDTRGIARRGSYKNENSGNKDSGEHNAEDNDDT